jgi:hypothetical protein
MKSISPEYQKHCNRITEAVRVTGLALGSNYYEWLPFFLGKKWTGAYEPNARNKEKKSIDLEIVQACQPMYAWLEAGVDKFMHGTSNPLGIPAKMKQVAWTWFCLSEEQRMTHYRLYKYAPSIWTEELKNFLQRSETQDNFASFADIPDDIKFIIYEAFVRLIYEDFGLPLAIVGVRFCPLACLDTRPKVASQAEQSSTEDVHTLAWRPRVF